MVRASSPPAKKPAGDANGQRSDEPLAEMQNRLDDIVDTGNSMQALLEAMLAVASGLELEATLRRIVSAATGLVHARYGALEVQGTDTSVVRFVHVGDATSGDHTSDPPHGHGLLGGLISDPTPLRLPDLRKYPLSAGFPPDHPPMRSFLGVLVRVGTEVYGKLYLTERDNGEEFTADDQVVVQALAAAAGVAVQNSRLFEECQRRQRRLEAAGEIATELLTGSTAPRVLQVVAQHAMQLCQADGAYIMLSEPYPESTSSRLGGHAGLTDDQVAKLDDEGTEPAGFGPSMSVPLRSHGETVGAIVALRLGGREQFRADELPVLASFADHASIVLEVAAKQRAQRQLGIFSDRDRIARDLHDHVIQRLFAAGMSLQGTLQRSTKPEVQARILDTIDQLDRTMSEIRTSIFDLHTPSGTAPTSLRRRLLDVIGEVSDDSRLSPSIRITGPLDTVVTSRLADHAEAVVREAVTNAIRHADASELVVTLDATDRLTILVEDDGCGIPVDTRRSGLTNLDHRAAECGGTCEISTRPGGGTQLRWTVPLPR